MADAKFIATIEISDPMNWIFLKRKIKELLGFEVFNYRDTFLKRRIETRLRRNDVRSYAEYARLLEKSKEERDNLEKELTIHVTHFFRDLSLFRELQEWVFPQAIKEKMENNDPYLYIWSAGSSTGQEAYSIAMVLREVLKDNINDFTVRIVGSDIDQRTVGNAIMGLYGEESLAEIPDYYKNKYLINVGGAYSVVPELKEMVRFQKEDITNPRTKLRFDFVFCRNTIIYLERGVKNELFKSIYKRLKLGGFLILGKTEFLDGEAKENFEIFNTPERIYRKKA